MKKIFVLTAVLGLFFIGQLDQTQASSTVQGQKAAASQVKSSSVNQVSSYQFNVTTSGTTGVHSVSTGLTNAQLNSSGTLITVNAQTTYEDFMNKVRAAGGMSETTAFSVYLGDVDLSNKLAFKDWNMSKTNGASLFVDYQYTNLLGDGYAGQFRVINGSDNSSHMTGFDENGSYSDFMSIIRYLCGFDATTPLSVYTKSGVSDLGIEGNYTVWNFSTTDGRTLYVIPRTDTASLNKLRSA